MHKGFSKAGPSGLVCAQSAELKVDNNTGGPVLKHPRAVLKANMSSPEQSTYANAD